MTIDSYKGKFTKCTNEQQFKMLFLKEAYNKEKFHCFCIETEETVKGFPDVLCIEKLYDKVSFEEFKFAKNGKIKFQPTQPSFYKRYSDLSIRVIAYNSMSDTVHSFDALDIFNKESPYCINEKAEIDLCKVEKEL